VSAISSRTGSAFKISAGRLLNFSAPFTALVEDCTFTGGSSGSAGITMSFSGARGSVVFSRGVIGPTAGPGLLLEDHTVGSAVAVFDRMKLIGTDFGPFVQGMAGWPENCSAPICIHCGSPFCLETAPDDYDAITDRTPGGLVFTQLEVDPACDGVGNGTWHCLPQHGNRGPGEPFAVVSTAAAARPAAPVASGSVIVHATDKRACSVARDTPTAFRDVLVDCRVKGAPTKTDDKSAQGRTRAPPPPAPPAKVGYQHAFPQTGPDSPACLDGKAYTITYQLSTSGSTKWSFSIPCVPSFAVPPLPRCRSRAHRTLCYE